MRRSRRIWLLVPALLLTATGASAQRPVDLRVPASADAEARVRGWMAELQRIGERVQAAHARALRDPALRTVSDALGREVNAAMEAIDPGLPALADRLRAIEAEAARARSEGDTLGLRALAEEQAGIRARFMRAREAAVRRPDLAARIRTYEERLHARMSQVEPALDSLLLRGELLQTRLAELMERRERTRSGPQP